MKIAIIIMAALAAGIISFGIIAYNVGKEMNYMRSCGMRGHR